VKIFALRLSNFYKKRVSIFANRRIRKIRNNQAVITFTFDDFPRSSYLVGGKILDDFGFKATYYTSFGLMGKELPVGKAFIKDDVLNLSMDGHELGCHTFDHYESWKTGTTYFNRSIQKNFEILRDILPQANFRTFSYPKTNPNPGNKAIAGKYFDSCRAGGQEYNVRKVDLNLLKSYFIDKKNNENFLELTNLIDLACEQNGWLIISTHDISHYPSSFGCSINYFRRIAQYVAGKNISVLKISEVIDRYCT